MAGHGRVAGCAPRSRTSQCARSGALPRLALAHPGSALADGAMAARQFDASATLGTLGYRGAMQPERPFPSVVEIVVEIPRGSRNKYEYDEHAGIFRLDRVLSSAVY